MSRKFLFAILGLFCLVPAHYAAPSSTSKETSEDVTENKSFVEGLKLFTITVEEFTSLYNDVIETGPEVFKKVLKDPKIFEVKTDAMKENTQILKNYLEKYEKYENDKNNTKLFELVEEFKDIVNKFDSEEHDNLSPEALAIEKSLNEHGLQEVEQSIQKHSVAFLEKFTAEVQRYISELSDKEKKGEKRLIDWYEKFKAEEDTEKKVDIFLSFFDMDDD